MNTTSATRGYGWSWMAMASQQHDLTVTTAEQQWLNGLNGNGFMATLVSMVTTQMQKFQATAWQQLQLQWLDGDMAPWEWLDKDNSMTTDQRWWQWLHGNTGLNSIDSNAMARQWPIVMASQWCGSTALDGNGSMVMMIAMTSWRWWIKGDRLTAKGWRQELYRGCLTVPALWQWQWQWLQSLMTWLLLLNGNYSTTMAPLKLLDCDGNCDGFMVTRLGGNGSIANIVSNGNGNGNCNGDGFAESYLEHYCLMAISRWQ